MAITARGFRSRASACAPQVTPLRGCLLALSLVLAGCQTAPTLGGGGGVTATGGAAGETASGANPELERCNEALGTVAIDEDFRAAWYFDLQRQRLGPTTPLLRMMVQQSNCFVVVERGQSTNAMLRERQLERSGEMRPGSGVGPGQIVAADYTMQPSVAFSQRGTQGLGVGVGGVIGNVASAVGGTVRANEAATTLLMIDNRSGVQLAAATGSARNWDVGGVVGLFGSAIGTVGGGYSNTPEGRIITAAFMDSYNQLVRSVRNYRAQTVRGGLGTGGALGVQGGGTPASQAVQPAPAPAPADRSRPPATGTPR